MCEVCEKRAAMVEVTYWNDDGDKVVLRVCLRCARLYT